MVNLRQLLAAMLMGATLVSCEKTVIDSTEPVGGSDNGSAKLIVTTRGNEDNSTTGLKEGRIYVFNSAGKCVKLLSTDENSLEATTRLAAGTYSLYAIGSTDLSRFNLPTEAEATPTSVITLKEGQEMTEFFEKSVEVTLADDETKEQPITLDRKVLGVSKIEIKSVPDEVTKVEVGLSSFYGSIRVDGTYPETPITNYRVELEKQNDGSWLITPNQMLFPSVGVPTIEVVYTLAAGTMSFSYTATEAMVANYKVNITGTYKQGAQMTCQLTAQAWGDDKDVNFDFNEENQVVYHPVAGEFCNGYYCVTANDATGKAVLLAKNKITYTAPSASDEAAWLAALVGPMAALDKPAGISNNWRLPTLAEAEIISKDEQIQEFSSAGNSAAYFCKDGNGALNWGYTNKNENNYTFHTGTQFASSVTLRPVIDLDY